MLKGYFSKHLSNNIWSFIPEQELRRIECRSWLSSRATFPSATSDEERVRREDGSTGQIACSGWSPENVLVNKTINKLVNKDLVDNHLKVDK